jgi:uncharacterized protein (TIGR02246 family)
MRSAVYLVSKSRISHVLMLSLLLLGIAGVAWAGDKEDVAAAMNMWRDNLAASRSEKPDKVVSLYAEDAALWGTLSPTLRATPALIRDYFVNAYKALPKLTVTFKDPHIRVYGNTAINSGYYTFSYLKDGKPTDLPARYSFVYVKRGGKWLIVDHHSSAMPAPPK